MENGKMKPAAKVTSIGYTIRTNMRQYAMLIALIVIMIFFQIATDGVLLVPMNVTNLILQNSYVLIGHWNDALYFMVVISIFLSVRWLLSPLPSGHRLSAK